MKKRNRFALRIFPDKKCEFCRKKFNRHRQPNGRLESASEFQKRKYCSFECYVEHQKCENHWNHKSSGSRRKDGYIRITTREGRFYLHRYLMAKKLKRKLAPSEHVHHIDGNPSNNELSNLELISAEEHSRYHARIWKRAKGGMFS